MKIIKNGRKQKGWTIENKCTGFGNGGGGCGALLLIEQDDLYCTSSSCRDEIDFFITFRCLACEVETDILDCPSKIRTEIIAKAKKN